MKRDRVQLRKYKVNSIVWNKIMKEYEAELEKDPNIYSKFYGYKRKHTIFYDEEFMVIQEYRYNYICKQIYGEDIIKQPSLWKQVVLRFDDEVDKPIKEVSGAYSYTYIMNLLTQDYTEQEIEDILNSHSAEKDPALSQFRYDYSTPMANTVFKINMVWKYDIHKAHASIIMELFPRSKHRILELLSKANKAKAKGNLELAKEYKDIPNLFVGYLCRVGHRETYNYIVQNTTRKLFAAMNEADGQLLYARTDSFCIKDPKKILPDSNEFGKFGLEYQGPAYICRGDNYTLYQFGDDQKGSCSKEVRHLFDMENGIIAKYKQNHIPIGNGKHYRMEIADICTEKVNVVEL